MTSARIAVLASGQVAARNRPHGNEGPPTRRIQRSDLHAVQSSPSATYGLKREGQDEPTLVVGPALDSLILGIRSNTKSIGHA